jgi:predicted 3-demethylubiquinone-9 3-methyltransferase (glyoxalase superfamily)
MQEITTFLMFDGKAEEAIEALFNKLSGGGQIFMPLSSYPFSKKFGWLSDKFGVSWQLNLTDQ